MGESSILIVRHGEGRGRGANPNYMHRTLDYLQLKRPDLHQRLVFHYTGNPAPSLAGIGAIVFWLKNPLRVHYPACYDDAIWIAEEARKESIPLINPPDALADFNKSGQGRLWRAAAIPTPEVERFETLESLRKAAERLAFPVVLRADEQHSQKATYVVRDRGELLKLGGTDLIFPCAVSTFIDIRSGYRDAAPRSAYARLFHKKRLIVANGVIRTKHIMFSSSPIVGAKTSIYNKAARLGRFEAPFLLWPLHRECIARDLAYWQQGEEHTALMLKACDTLGLKFAALDYSDMSDGTPVLWEANPLFGLPKFQKIMLPRRRRAAERVLSYHEAIGMFLGELPMARRAVPAGAGRSLKAGAG